MAVCVAVGPDFPIAMRISQWKMNDYQARLFDTPEQLEQFLHLLVDAGVDIFHCSTRRFWEPEFEGSELWICRLGAKAKWSNHHYRRFCGYPDEPEAGADKTTHPGMSELMKRYEQEEFDLVAVGRALLGDPAWFQNTRRTRIRIQAFTPEVLATLH